MSEDAKRGPAPIPHEIHAPEGAQLLEVVWDDGSSSLLPHRLLRGMCPCAQCQGHQGPIQWVNAVESLPPAKLELAELHEVGSYAIGMTFRDGHSTGIYTFRYLHSLGGVEDHSIEHLRELKFER